MAMATNPATGQRQRRQRDDSDRAAARLVKVASGRGWALWWPRAAWEELTAAERQSIIDRQSELMRAEKRPSN